MNGSEQHLSFPVQAAGVDPIEGGARREGEIRSVDLSNEGTICRYSSVKESEE